MKVLAGPTFSIDVSSAEELPGSLFSKEEASEIGEKGVVSGRIGSGVGFGSTEDSSESSSSIGAPDDSDEDEVDSGVTLNSGLGSLDSLEESLPIKRGLSNHFAGKSKSFANLHEMSSITSAKDLQKQENPFNKRRRILMANKWSRKSSSFYSWHNPNSMPLLALNEEEDHEEKLQEEYDHDNPSSSSSSSSPRPDKLLLRPDMSVVPMSKLKATAFKSQSCFSLADLGDRHD